MAFNLVNRVRESTISPGTGTATLAGAALGYQTFSAGVGANNTTYYVIADQSGANWEVGYGTVGAAGTTLVRTTVLSSSNAGSLVNFSSGTQDVWVDYPANKAVFQDINGLVTVPTFATSSTTSTTPVLSFNASNTSFASGATVSGNYLQFLLQNKSGTATASTNYVLSNDLGTDSTYYGEFGMNSSVFSASTPTDFFSINNGVYFSGHDGDIAVGSGNGFKTYLAWGTTGQSAHVINASGALGFSTNLGTTPALSGTTGYGTAGQVPISAGSTGAVVWSSTPTLTGTNFTGVPISTAISGLGTGVATALAIAIGSAGALVTFNGALGTPSSGSGANITSLNASNLASGTVPTARLGSGTASASTFLAGDQTYKTISVTPAAVSDQANTSTGYFGFPKGTTAQRPGSPTTGMIRYNTTTNAYEVYISSAWQPLSIAPYSASYLVVAGGASGGTIYGGGGGAGGLIAGSTTFTSGTTYTVTVGAGGAGGSIAGTGNNGNNSVLSGSGLTTQTAIGGGGGAWAQTSGGSALGAAGNNGGSGGGGCSFRNSIGTTSTQNPGSGTSGQGNAGGTASSVTSNQNGYGAGGGGAGASGGTGSPQTTGGNGGSGLASSITGSSITYAGGGGGSSYGGTFGTGGSGGGGNGGNSSTTAGAGSANTGGGGGGASNFDSLVGAGGSGVVILSIPTSWYSGTTTGSPTVTTSGSNTIITFTSSGSYTA